MKTSTYQLDLVSIVPFLVFAAESVEQNKDQLLQASCQALAETPKQLSPRTDTAKMLRGIIFKALRAEYPCGKSY